MSILKELTEETTDRQDSKKLAHLKTYTFFVFYQITQTFMPSTLHKMGFKLKDDKFGGVTDTRGTEQQRQVQMFFYHLEEEGERVRGLLDLKLAGLQSKSKIIGYCSQEQLLGLLSTGAKMGIDTSHFPIILAQTDPTSDLSIFSGWNELEAGPFSEMNINYLEQLSRKWIQSAPEKVDLWKVSLLLKEDGRLEKLKGQQFQTVETQHLKFQQLFISHLSLGYHVKLCKSYQQKRGSPEKKKTNSMIYSWESFKNFCCLGSSNMRSSTGVVNISFVDQRGEEHQILKHLREYDGSEESELEASRVVKSDRGIYSLLIANIDRFHGNKLEKLNCKPGDGRIEVILYEGVKQWRKIGSVAGEVVLGLESECVELQVGESVYRCWGGRELRIGQCGRARVAISRDVLSC